MHLENTWTALFVAGSFGAATTCWSKLRDRIQRGVVNLCPLLLIELPPSTITVDEQLDLDKILEANRTL